MNVTEKRGEEEISSPSLGASIYRDGTGHTERKEQLSRERGRKKKKREREQE